MAWQLSPCTAQGYTFNAQDSLDKGIAFAINQDYDAAKRLYEKVVRHFEKTNPEITPAYILAFRKLGIEHKARKSPDSMRVCLMKASALLQAHPVDSMMDLAIDHFNQIAVYYGRQRNLDSALAYCQRGEAYAIRNDLTNLEALGSLYTNMSIAHRLSGRYRKALDAAQKHVEITRNSPALSPAAKSTAYHTYSRGLYEAGMNTKAHAYIDTAIQYLKMDSSWSAVAMGDIFIRKAQYFDKQGKFDEMLDYLDRARQVMEAHLDPGHTKFAYLYHFYSTHYKMHRDYERALYYQQRVLSILDQAAKPDLKDDLGTAHSNLGDIHLELGQIDLARRHYARSLAIDMEVYGNTNETARSYINFGDMYFHLGEVDSALINYRAAEEIILDFYGPDHPEAAQLYDALGDQYRILGQYDLALTHYRKALAIHREGNVQDKQQQMTLSKIGKCFAEQGVKDSAYTYYLAGLDGLYSIGNAPGNIATGYNEHVALTLMHMAALESDPRESLIYLLPAEEILQRMTKAAAIGEEASVRYLDLFYALYGDIQAAYLALGDKSSALAFCEQSKSPLLRHQWIVSEVMREMQIPKTLLDQKRAIAYEINALKNQMASDPTEETRERIRILMEEKETIDAYVAQHFPDYKTFIDTPQRIDIGHLQSEHLASDEVIISYFIGRETGVAYLLTPSSIHTHSLNVTEVEQLASSLHQSLLSVADLDTLRATARHLSDQILYPFAGKLPAGTNRITIIPDGALHRIPFELLYLRPDALQETTLLRDYPVRYLSSIALLDHEARGQRGERIFAGFAADYAEMSLAASDTAEDHQLAMLVRSGNYALPGATAEVTEIASMLDGDSYIGVKASERQFWNTAKDYRLLHLSMHALPDFDNPAFAKLLFTPTSDTLHDGALMAGEVRHMQLNAQMVVLSACQTGAGAVARGEGVMSLARAFSMAGVPTTVMSLWKVPDAATREVMVRFYTYIDEGLSKDEALRLAKLDYLDNAKFAAQAHPVHWAGFVLSGQRHALKRELPVSKWAVVATLCGLLIIGAILSFRRRKQAA